MGDQLALRLAQRVTVTDIRVGTCHKILQGHILGPVLFKIFISAFDAGLGGMLNKLEDDTSLGGAVNSLQGREALQRDLNKEEGWAITNQIKFTKEKLDSPPVTGQCWVYGQTD